MDILIYVDLIKISKTDNDLDFKWRTKEKRDDFKNEKKGFALPQCIIIYNGFTDDDIISALEMCAMSQQIILLRMALPPTLNYIADTMFEMNARNMMLLKSLNQFHSEPNLRWLLLYWRNLILDFTAIWNFDGVIE